MYTKVVFLFLFLSTSIFAVEDEKIFLPDSQGNFIEQTTPDSTPTVEQVPSTPTKDPYQASFFKMLFSLFLLLLLLFLSFWFFKKIVKGRLLKTQQNKMIQVLEKRALSQKTILYVLEINKEKILIAESQLEIKKLHTLTNWEKFSSPEES